jgi:tRNA(adenine34) deaminase
MRENVMAWTAADEAWMRHAIALARRCEPGDGTNPIGCVIVRDGVIIGEARNEVGLRHDATAHAEIMAMRRAGDHLGQPELRGSVLYTTLQPCGMCTMASIWAKVSRIVYGAGRDDVHAMYFEDRHLDTVDFIRDAFRDDLALDGGLMAPACAELYVPPGAVVPEEERFNT